MKSVVTNRQIFFILLFTVTSNTIRIIPKIAYKASGTGAWFTIIILTIIFSIGVFIITSLNKQFEGKTLDEYSKILVGNFLSKVISAFYTGYFLFILILLFKVTADFIKENSLPLTPIWVTIIIFISTAFFIAYKGITNIGRMLEIYGLIFVFVSLFAHTCELILGDINYIKPFFEPIQLKKYIVGIKDLIFPFLGIEVLTIIPFGKENRKRGITYAVLAILYIGIFYIFATETSVMIIGQNDIQNYSNPLVEGLRETKLPSTFLLERMDLLYFSIGIMGIISGLTLLTFVTVEYSSKIIIAINKKILFVVIGIITYISSVFVVKTEMVTILIESIIPLIGLFAAFIIPLFLFIIARVKKYER